MAFTQADLDTIRQNIASGVLETRFADGSMVRYQTTADMLKAELRIAGAVASSVPGLAARRIRRPAYRSGF